MAMPDRPGPFSSDVVLRDGSTVHLREAAPADARALGTFFGSLSPESRHFRYFDTRATSSAADAAGELARARDALGLVLVGEHADRLCAVASLVRDGPQATRAEVAFAIVDGFQGRGIGTRMLEALADAARARGIEQFDAYVLSDNDRMMRVFLDSGFEVESELDAGVFHVRLSLAPTAVSLRRAAERSDTAATASMQAFFAPARIAVIGANRERGKIGAEVLHNIVAGGFTGEVVAVHPSAATIANVPAYPNVRAVPGPIDLAVVCVPAALVNAVAEDCVAKGVKALVVISAGFAETGAAGQLLEQRLVATVRRAGMRLVGPNCMGLINTAPAVRLNATFAPVAPPVGRVAMSTQSGALGLAILDYARQLHIGLSTFVSVGNKPDVSSNDLIQYWGNDEHTDVILLYLESFGNPRNFSRIARRVGRRKPIVAVKAGRSAAGARAAASHTGALASGDTIVDALFRQAGVIRTNTLEELFDVATLLAHQPIPRGRRVAVLTNAGGPGILAADACEAHGLTLPSLSDATVAELRSFLPAAASVANPVDMIASASAEHYERTLGALLRDDRVDSVLVIFIPPLVTKLEDVAAAVRRVAGDPASEVAAGRPPRKTVAGIFMSAKGAPPELSPIPCFMFPEAAAVALAHAADRGDWLRRPQGTAATFADFDRTGARAVVDKALARGGGWLAPTDIDALLTAVKIPGVASATSVDETGAVEAAGRIGYPVVLKAVGPQIVHKSEIGGVAVGLIDAGAVREAWRDMAGRLGEKMTSGLVQEMVTGGVEMLVGATDDPTFGPLVACAMGGTLAELISDSAFRLHPLTEQDAAEMIDSLRGVRLLRGYRGRPAADEAALRETLLSLSALVDICPEIQELDINPLRVLPKGARALDVRVRVSSPRPAPSTRRVS